MKKIIGLFLVFAAAAACGWAIEPVEGYWLSVEKNKVTAGWIIYQEKGKLYGKMLSVAGRRQGGIAERCKEAYPPRRLYSNRQGSEYRNLPGFPIAGSVNQMPIAGTPWIYGLIKERDHRWVGGAIINPENGSCSPCAITYHFADGKRFKADTLEMRSELVMGGWIGVSRSQFWQKTDRQTANSLWSK